AIPPAAPTRLHALPARQRPPRPPVPRLRPRGPGGRRGGRPPPRRAAGRGRPGPRRARAARARRPAARLGRRRRPPAEEHRADRIRIPSSRAEPMGGAPGPAGLLSVVPAVVAPAVAGPAQLIGELMNRSMLQRTPERGDHVYEFRVEPSWGTGTSSEPA